MVAVFSKTLAVCLDHNLDFRLKYTQALKLFHLWITKFLIVVPVAFQRQTLRFKVCFYFIGKQIKVIYTLCLLKPVMLKKLTPLKNCK